MDIVQISIDHHNQAFDEAVESVTEENTVVALYHAFINDSLKSIQFLQDELTYHTRLLEKYTNKDLETKWTAKDNIDLILECIHQETENIDAYREVIRNANH